jgi:hypothetical protein
MAEDRPFGGVGSKKLFEHDHLLIQVAGDRVAVVPEPDTQSRYKDYMEADVRPGQVAFVGRGGVERARNVGSKPYREIIVELI